LKSFKKNDKNIENKKGSVGEFWRTNNFLCPIISFIDSLFLFEKQLEIEVDLKDQKMQCSN